jgi:hypothetical protein
MILAPIGNQILNLENLAKAEYKPVDPDLAEDWIELHLLWKDGAATVVYGDEADLTWSLIQRLAGVPDIYPVNSLQLQTR